MSVFCQRISHHDASLNAITTRMQFTFNPEARPWQPDAPVKTAWQEGRNKRQVHQSLGSAKNGHSKGLPSLEAEENAFPALGGCSNAGSDSVTKPAAAVNGDANKAGVVAPVKGFSWAAVVSDKPNGSAASAAPASTQPSLLTAALAGSHVAQPEVWHSL